MIAAEIAGVTCRIECGDPAFAALLAARYSEFVADGPADALLTVELTAEPPDADLLQWTGPFARFAARGAAIEISGPGFRGGFDTRTGRGRITQPPDPAPLETLLTAIIAGRLLDQGGFLLHAAAILGADGARVFFGPSGSGKTTVATLVGAGVITDEITAIRRASGGWRVSGVPWRGTRLEGDLAGIFRLARGPATRFRRLGPAEAARELFGSAFFPLADGHEIGRFLDTVGDLVAAVDAWEMAFTPDRAFWDAVPRRAVEVTG